MLAPATRPQSDPALIAGIMALVPNLRGYAMRLSGRSDRGDDLVQETLLRAIAHIRSFQPGTCMDAWLFTIMRNCFYSTYRKIKHECRLPDYCENDLRISAGGERAEIARLDLERVLGLIECDLPVEQREAITLVAIDGLSYEEAALSAGCNVGTMKSRVNRARVRLAQLLGDPLPAGAPSAEEEDAWRGVGTSGALDDFALAEEGWDARPH